MATPTLRPANRSDTYGTATTSRPGISSPWTARSSSSTPRLGASPSNAVGTTSSAAEAIITRARPTRSDSGPCTQPPKATPSTTTVIGEAGRGRRHVQAVLDLGQDRLRGVHVREHRRRAQEQGDRRARPAGVSRHARPRAAGPAARAAPPRRRSSRSSSSPASSRRQPRSSGWSSPPSATTADQGLQIVACRHQLGCDAGLGADRLQHRAGQRQHHLDAVAELGRQLGGPLGRGAVGLGQHGQQPVQLGAVLQLQAAHRPCLLGRARPPPGQLDQGRVAHQPAGGDVAPPRLALAPGGEPRPGPPAARRAACRGPRRGARPGRDPAPAAHRARSAAPSPRPPSARGPGCAAAPAARPSPPAGAARRRRRRQPGSRSAAASTSR